LYNVVETHADTADPNALNARKKRSDDEESKRDRIMPGEILVEQK